MEFLEGIVWVGLVSFMVICSIVRIACTRGFEFFATIQSLHLHLGAYATACLIIGPAWDLYQPVLEGSYSGWAILYLLGAVLKVGLCDLVGVLWFSQVPEYLGPEVPGNLYKYVNKFLTYPED
jgi:hypothetical protein